MKVALILLKDIKNLGRLGDICEVKRGFSTYLLNQEWALRATKKNQHLFEEKKEALEASSRKLYETACETKDKLIGLNLNFIRQAGETGQLYGSLTIKNLCEALKEKGFDVKPHMLFLNKPIKTTGHHVFTVQLHPAIDVDVKLIVGRTEIEVQHFLNERTTLNQVVDKQHEEKQPSNENSSAGNTKESEQT